MKEQNHGGYLSPEVVMLRDTAMIALFAALITAGAYVSIPIGPVPLAVQSFFVLAAAAVLGPKKGAACVGLYLFLGILGLPVFAGGTGGFARLAGPTGGYLVGYLPLAVVVGILTARRRIFQVAAGMIAGTAILYAFGVSWLKFSTGMEWPAAVAAGLTPFIAGDAVKIAAATLLYLMLPSSLIPREPEKTDHAIEDDPQDPLMRDAERETKGQ